MKLIRVISLNVWLPVLVCLSFFILAVVMVFNQRNELIASQINSSIAFIKNDLNVLTLEMQTELAQGSEVESKRAFSMRGLINEYKVFVLLNDEGRNILSIHNNNVGQLAKTIFPNFDSTCFARALKKRQAEIHLDNDANIITAYYPVVLERKANEIRPTKTGIIFLVFDLNFSMEKIWEHIWQSSQLPLFIGLVSIILVLIFLKVYVSKPLQHLILMTKQLARGDLGIKNQLFGKGELIELANSFNSMSQQLEKEHLLLRESELRQQEIIWSTNVGTWEWNIASGETKFNARWAEIIGYSLEELGIIDEVKWKELIHPDDYDESNHQLQKLFSAEIDYYQCEIRMRHKNARWIWVLDRGKVVEWTQDRKPLRMTGTVTDINDRKNSDELLSYQAKHDALTGLVNRSEFERRVQRLLETTGQDNSTHALCYLDLDQFKVVNDTCGHTAGDELLRQLGSLLHEFVRHRDTLARLGGDEFGVLMEHCSLDHAFRVVSKLQDIINDYQFNSEGHVFKIGASFGLVAIDTTTVSLSELLKDADAACYMAKENGRNCIHVYDAGDTEIAQRHGEMQWVVKLQQAIDEDRFCLYAQAIISLNSSCKKRYELLIRLLDNDNNVIPPGAFLPAAERYNLIRTLDRWVIKKTLNTLANHPDFLTEIEYCAINLSGQSLTQQATLNFIIEQLDATKIDPHKICFEITETAAISNLASAMKFINTLKGIGCRFALDDFGSGLSSFAYLKNLPVDYLKIDGAFVKDIVHDRIDHAMVKSINEVGQVMGMQTIAEFVENDEIKGMLREIGVNFAQGYGIAKPLPFSELVSHTN